MVCFTFISAGTKPRSFGLFERNQTILSFLLSPLFLPHPFLKQPGVKIPFLNSRTSSQLLRPFSSSSKLLNCSLSSCVGFLNLFCISLQYILVAESHFWMTKDSLNLFFFFIFPSLKLRTVTSTVGKIQRHEMRPLTRCQRTTVIQHIIWADIHVSFFCKEHFALKKKVWKLRTKDWTMNWISSVNLWKEMGWQPVTSSFLQTLGMAITPHDLEFFSHSAHNPVCLPNKNCLSHYSQKSNLSCKGKSL